MSLEMPNRTDLLTAAGFISGNYGDPDLGLEPTGAPLDDDPDRLAEYINECERTGAIAQPIKDSAAAKLGKATSAWCLDCPAELMPGSRCPHLEVYADGRRRIIG